MLPLHPLLFCLYFDVLYSRCVSHSHALLFHRCLLIIPITEVLITFVINFSPAPVTAPVAAASWETEVWALLNDPTMVADAAALKAHLADLGATKASMVLEFDEDDIAAIAALLKKLPRKKLLKIYKERQQ
jgi:hypothetical protein